jgi:ribosomal protein S27AE
MSVFRPDRLPSLNRLPKELGREERFCEACGEATVHILYRVPKKVILLYIRDHPKNVHATCIRCARSIILTGEERARALSMLKGDPPSGTEPGEPL